MTISSDQAGRFDIEVVVLGVSFKKMELLFEDLLQAQYDGTTVMTLFDMAKVNVNLLIYTINKK